LLFVDSLGIAICREVEPHAMLEKRLEASERQRNPCVESATYFTSSSPLPVKPDSVTLTKVVASFCDANFHSTVVGPLYPGHSMTIRLFGSIALAVTWIETSYISQSHRIGLPISSLPLPS
jgi:hypothetical protein